MCRSSRDTEKRIQPSGSNHERDLEAVQIWRVTKETAGCYHGNVCRGINRGLAELACEKQSRFYLFERSEFLIDTSQKKSLPRVHVCTCAIILVLVCGIMYHIQKDCLGFSVGYQRAPGTSEKKKERLVPASASLPTAGSALPPVGRATPLLW